MKTSFFSFLALAALTSTVCAGDAFFSAGGKTITFAPLIRTGVLWRLDVASGKLKALPLPADLKDASVTGLAVGAEGETLFNTEKAAWVMKDDGTVKRIADIGPATEPANLFVGTKPGTPLMDWLFVSATGKDDLTSRIFFARKPGTKAFSEVFCRRARMVDCGCFSSDGRFFFAEHGDVWEGGFAVEDDPGARAATLVGVRIAPLATLNTDGANAGSAFVRGLCPAGKWLYAGLGGRHFGSILRMAIPAKPLYTPNTDELPDGKAQLDAMRQSLEKTELLVAETGGLSAFCACEVDGQGRVFYRGESDEKGIGLWLWDGSGEPKRLANEPKE